MSELQLKGWLVNALQGTWIDVISPGAGSTFGYPDLGMLVPGTSLYIPIELKLAEVKATPKRVVKKGVFFRDVAHPDGDYRYETIPAENRVRPSRLRPSQVAWHDGFTRAGGYSRLVLAVFSANGWDVWVIDRPRQEQLKDWKKGFILEELALVTLKEGQLDLGAWWYGPRQWWQQPAEQLAGALERAVR